MTTVLVDFVRWLNTAPGWLPVLVSVGLKATALLVLAWLASLLFRRSSAAMRHVVWTVALAGSLALPLLLPVMPRWPLPVLPLDASASSAVAAAPELGAPGLAEPPSPAGGRETTSAPRPAPAAAWRVDATTVLVTVWAVVAITLLLRLAWGIVRVRRFARRDAEGEPWLPLARDLAARSGVAGRVTFATGRPDAMPMTWGFVRPVVLVPEGAEAWPEARLSTVLLHELAHVRRYDCLTQTLAGAVCAVYWFNPLAWLAAGRLVAERERACDDAVLAAGADGGDYAEQLLDVARAMRPHGVLTWASVSMARRSQLEGRLLAILDPDLPRRVPTRAAAAVLVLCLGVLVPSLAAVQLAPRADAGLVLPSPSSLMDEAVADTAAQATPPPQAGQSVPAPRPMPTPTPTPMPTPGAGRASGSDGESRRPVDQKVIDALTAAMKDTDLEVREHAVMALGRLRDKRATPALTAALADSSADVRENAAQALGQARDAAAVAPLVAALKDTDADVREQAAFALSQLRDPAAAPALAGLLADKEAQVRERAAFALGQIRDPAAVDGLILALKDPSPDVQEQAAFALSQIRDKRAVDPLIALLSGGGSPDAREHAAFALGQIRDPRATDALMAAMKDTHADVRKAAAFALSQVIGRDQ